MEIKGYIACPYLKVEINGIMCDVTGNLVRDMEDADIRLCVCRRYEGCGVYANFLQKEAIRSINPDIASERA